MSGELRLRSLDDDVFDSLGIDSCVRFVCENICVFALTFGVKWQQKGNASTANASVLLRSKFILGRKPLFKFDSVSLPRGGSGRRSRLLAIAEIDYAVIGAEQQLIDSATISTSPVGSEIEVLFLHLLYFAQTTSL